MAVRRSASDAAAAPVHAASVPDDDELRPEKARILQDRGVELRLVRAHGAMLACLRTAGTRETIGQDKAFARVELAVARDA